ncbi:MAG: 3-methyladenine DNA glycosylase Tag [Halieaceae bacterium]|jgi:3-methyladenine DNA glycosylase Tag
MPRFETIYARASERKGGDAALEDLLSPAPAPAPAPVALARLPADRYLAEFSKKIFQSGFVWRVVENKWDGFEELFWGFDVDKLLMMPEDMLERKAQDTRIIRNYRKVLAIRDNAAMIALTERQQGMRFGEFIAAWPPTDSIGLWLYLKKHGSRLGGNTGPYALRNLGYDTFLLTADVEGFLRLHDIVDGGINSKRSLTAAQAFFNELQEESGRSLRELSRLVSFSFGKNVVGLSGSL